MKPSEVTPLTALVSVSRAPFAHERLTIGQKLSELIVEAG